MSQAIETMRFPEKRMNSVVIAAKECLSSMVPYGISKPNTSGTRINNC
ncbi:MAG: hypothetical protein QXP70_06105 [Methanomassiliicoccales archaeon]